MSSFKRSTWDIFWENQAIPGKAKKWPTQILLILICIIHIIVKSKTLNFFSLKLYGLDVWAQQNSHQEEKIYSFSEKYVFKGKFGLRAMRTLKVFIRCRKYGLGGSRDHAKRFVQVLPKLITRPWKHNFFNFWSTLGANIWGHKLHIDTNAYPGSQPHGVKILCRWCPG